MTLTELAVGIALGMCAQAAIRNFTGALAKAAIYVAMKRSPRLVEFLRSDEAEKQMLLSQVGWNKNK